MLKKLLSISYSQKMMLNFLHSSRRGSIFSSFIGPIIVALSIYGQIPNLNLTIWLSLHLTIFLLRFIFSNKLLNLLPQITSIKAFSKQNDELHLYFNLYLLSIFLNAFLYGIISFGFNLYNVTDLTIFITAIAITALTAGSILTLGFVFIAFLGFCIFSILPFMLAMIYHGESSYYTLALILSVYIIIHVTSGYKLFQRYNTSFKLEDKFLTIFNKSSDGIVIIKNGRDIEYNETTIAMFGYEEYAEEFITTNLAFLSPKKQFDGSNSKRKMLEMLKKGQHTTTRFPWQHMKKDGEIFWVEITLRPITISGEKVIHGVWRDINERKVVENALEDLNDSLELRVEEAVKLNKIKDQQLLQQSRLAQMGEMISMIAHQWRQPLNAISLTSNNLLLKCLFEDIDKNYFKKELLLIDNFSQHLSKTIDDFRNFFQNNKDKEDSNLSTIINSTLNIIRTSTETKNIQIQTDLKSTELFKIYPNEVKQVVLNIIQNAEDILLERKINKPKIIIQTYDNIISISDNAGGIAPDIIDKIFDPYFSTKLEKNGTGLGLYMSKTIIQEHCNGLLHVENNNDGAVFKIEFKKRGKNDKNDT